MTVVALFEANKETVFGPAPMDALARIGHKAAVEQLGFMVDRAATILKEGALELPIDIRTHVSRNRDLLAHESFISLASISPQTREAIEDVHGKFCAFFDQVDQALNPTAP